MKVPGAYYLPPNTVTCKEQQFEGTNVGCKIIVKEESPLYITINSVNMHAYISNSVDNTSTPLITYSREKLFRLCSFQYSTPQLSGYFSYNKTKTNYHGCRAGKKVKEKRSKIFMNIPVVNIHQSRKTAKRHTAEQNRTRNLVKIKTRKIPTISKLVPKCVVMNARSLAKPDVAPALYAELKSNNIDVCFVSESWLNKRIYHT